MMDSSSIETLFDLPDGSYSITWTSERINRLLLHNREIHLWSDFHSFNLVSNQLWSSEQTMSLTKTEAMEVVFEWVSNGAFISHIEDMKRIPASVRGRLKSRIAVDEKVTKS